MKVTDIVDLDDLYTYGKNTEIFMRKESNKEFCEYKKIYESVLKKVPDTPGWYIWFQNTDKGLTVIYIGSTGKSLKERLEKELKDEYVVFFMKHWDDQDTVNRLNTLYDGKYKKHIQRSSKKYGANKILWYKCNGDEVSDEDLDIVEMKLINRFCETVYNEIQKNYRRIDSNLFEKVYEEIDKTLKSCGPYVSLY